MLIRYGFDIELDFDRPSTLVTAMDVHPERRSDVVGDMVAPLDFGLKLHTFFDDYGNFRRRIESRRSGRISLRLDGLIRDGGQPDPVLSWLQQTPLADLPDDTLGYLAPTRYCDSDMLSEFATTAFGNVAGGWTKVEAICDFVHERLARRSPDHGDASPALTASQIMDASVGAPVDFAHLAMALCRAVTIPARFCHGYLAVGKRPGTFHAWFEAYLAGAWHVFDPSYRQPQTGRVLVARGRDAADIPLLNVFGRHTVRRFEVTTDEVAEAGRLHAVA